MSVVINGVTRTVTAPRQRAVLAYLAVRAGEEVSADALLDAVWGDEQPAAATKAVSFQIWKLRNALEPDRDGEGELISTTPAGYELRVHPDRVDVHRFERLISSARDVLTVDPARSQSLAEEALQLWRGQPFVGLRREPFLDDETRRLEQLHLLARRTLVKGLIAQGRHGEVIGDIEAMIVEQPLDEELVELLMTVLQRSGRAADALRAFGELRIRLSRELGIEPSKKLRRLEREILDGGPGSMPHASPREPEPAPNHRLPIPVAATSFVGRQDDVDGISEMLRSMRLVTLCGFGGLGKTRLASEVAVSVADRFGDGVWYVDLTSVDEPKLLVDAFLAAGGLSVTWEHDPRDRLLEHLLNRDVLVVIDNCEHIVADVARLVAAIVRTASKVRILATSRVALGVHGEAIWVMHPLAVESSSELLVDRARSVRPEITIEDADRADLERLAGRLDGIPLAIELAAARLGVLSIAQIAGLLDDRFGLLVTPARGAEEKPRSLAAVLDWSYELLDEPDRRMLRRLSVCVGGFDLDAAARIGLPDDDDSTLAEVINGLERLVRATLIDFDDSAEEPRYRMLETIREYASSRLEAEGPNERPDAGRSHAEYYASVARRIHELQFEDHDRWLQLGNRESPNVRAGISWAYCHGQPRLGLTMTRNLWSYLGRDGSGQAYARTAVDLIGDDSPDVLVATALALIHDNEVEVDIDFHEFASARVARGLETVDDPESRSILLRGLAFYHGFTDPIAADELLAAAVELQSVPPNVRLAAHNNRIVGSWETGRVTDEAATLRQIDEIVDINPSLSANAVSIRTMVEASGGRWSSVLRIAADADGLEGVDGYPMEHSSAEAFIGLGRYTEATAALERSKLVGTHREVMTYTPIAQACVLVAQGDPAGAVSALEPVTVFVRRDPRHLSIVARVVSMIAVAKHGLGSDETAATLFGHSIAEQERLGTTLRAFERPAAERALDECRSALGDDRFDALAASGASMEFADLPLDLLAELR